MARLPRSSPLHHQFIQIVSSFLAFERPPAAWFGMSNMMFLQPP